MISANDLRIGNWIQVINSTILKIDTDNIGDVVNNPTIFNPIPLTSEILIACGFEKHIGEAQGIGEYAWYDLGIYEVNIFPVGVKFLDIDHKYLKYLHQLQNLYYSLTGVELIYKKCISIAAKNKNYDRRK